MKIRKYSGVSVVMPTYNESGNIAELIAETVSSIKRSGYKDIEIIVVDDDSPDMTWKIASDVISPDADIRVIRRMENHGLTASIRDGISAASKDIIVWLDCDFSQSPDYIPQLLAAIENGCDVAVNSRYVPGGAEERVGEGGNMQRSLSRIMNRCLRLMLDSSFADYTSGFLAVRREVLDRFDLNGDYGEYFIDFIYRVLCDGSFKVCELPYVMQPRRYGVSKTGSTVFDYLIRGRKYIWTLIRLRFSIKR